MVYWHTCWKRFQDYLIAKWRPFNYAVLFGGFYGLYWFNRTLAERTFVYMDLEKMDRMKASERKRDFGFRPTYVPKIARSRKNMIIS